NPDHLTGPRSGDRVRDRRERDMTPPGSVPGHTVRLAVRKGTGPLEPDPADLRDQDRRPAGVVVAHTQGLSPHDPEPLMPPASAPRRPVVGTSEEVPPRLI